MSDAENAVAEKKGGEIKKTNKLIEVRRRMTPKQKLADLGKRIWRHKAFYIMLAPAVVLLAIFAYWPMYGVVIAFKDYSFRKGILGSEWVGFDNFKTIFGPDMAGFWPAFRNTIVINLLKLVFGFPAPIMLAIMLNAVKNKFLKNGIQTIVYLPHFVSWVIVAGLLFSLFDERSGAIFTLLQRFGIEANVFGDGNQFVAMLVWSDIWKEVGWGAIIYLAAITGIAPEYYEAARIDGAGTVKQFWYITLPLLMPTITIMLILRLGGLIGGGFDQIYNLYNTTVADKAEVLDTFVYKYGIGEGMFELGTAIGLFTNVINIILLGVANLTVRLVGGEGLY